MVPDGWGKTTLVGLIEIRHGFAFKSEYFTDVGQYVLMTPGSFYEQGGFRDQGSKTKYYSGEIPAGYLLSKGDILIAMTEQAEGLLGSAARVPADNKYLHNQRLGLIKINNPLKVSSDFIYWLYNFEGVRKLVSEQASGTKVRHTSPDRLTSITTLLPPINEQIRISKILSIWDQAIVTTGELLKNSQQQKMALIQQLLTGTKRLPQYTAPRKKLKLGSLLKEEKTRNTTNTVSRVLSVTNHSGFVLPEEQFSKRVASEDVRNYKIVRRGQFGYNPSRINVGSFARLDCYEVGLLSPMYVVFSINKDLLDSDFFMFWMESNEAKQRISS